jgi:hypothetical protein
MKVILDAQAYRRNNYARSAAFQSLLDYLKKTDSQIVLLASVEQEVLALYERELAAELSKVQAAVSTAKRKMFLRDQKLMLGQMPEVKKETRALQDALRSTSTGVAVERFQDYAGVNALDIVERGAQRIPPADSNGEQLRDVINWLAALSYARRASGKVFFVSADSGFWEKKDDQKELKPEIKEDIANAESKIEVYYDLEELLKRNSLSSEPLDQARADKAFKVSDFAEPISEKLKDILAGEMEGFVLSFVSNEVISSAFKNGIAYRISADSEYLEATYEITVRTVAQALPRQIKGGRQNYLEALFEPVPFANLSTYGSGTYGSGTYGGTLLVEFTTKAQADFSARVIQGAMSLAGIERVRIISTAKA